MDENSRWIFLKYISEINIHRVSKIDVSVWGNRCKEVARDVKSLFEQNMWKKNIFVKSKHVDKKYFIFYFFKGYIISYCLWNKDKDVAYL